MDKSVRVNGKEREIVSQKLITGYPHETNREMKDRHKKRIPIPKYQYIAIKIK